MKKLYIIGNGFDLHHDIKCSYSAFSKWLKLNHNDVYNEIIDLYGEEIVNQEWWNDFEINLGYFDIRGRIEHISWLNQPDADDKEKARYIDPREGAKDVQDDIGKTINDIKDCFHEWIDSLSPANKDLMIHIDAQDAYFINFNYSLTLENTYKIDTDNICHIHGSLNDDEYIIGHGRSKQEIQEETAPYLAPYDNHQDPSEYGIDARDDEITEETKQEMIKQIISIKKPVDKIISNLAVLNKLNSVQDVYIYGLSFSSVDEPYLKAIFSRLPQNAKLTISYYTEADKEKIKKFMDRHTHSLKIVRLQDIQVYPIVKCYSLFDDSQTAN